MSFHNGAPDQNPEMPTLTDRVDIEEVSVPDIKPLERDEEVAAEISRLLDRQVRQDEEVAQMFQSAGTRELLKRAADIAAMTSAGIHVKKSA